MGTLIDAVQFLVCFWLLGVALPIVISCVVVTAVHRLAGWDQEAERENERGNWAA